MEKIIDLPESSEEKKRKEGYFLEAERILNHLKLFDEKHSYEFIAGYASTLASANEARGLYFKDIFPDGIDSAYNEAYSAGMFRAESDLANKKVLLNNCIVEQKSLNGCQIHEERYEVIEVDKQDESDKNFFPEDQKVETLVEQLKDVEIFKEFFWGQIFRIARIKPEGVEYQLDAAIRLYDNHKPITEGLYNVICLVPTASFDKHFKPIFEPRAAFQDLQFDEMFGFSIEKRSYFNGMHVPSF